MIRQLWQWHRPYIGWLSLGLILSIAALLANISLLALSGWFISSMALAGITGMAINYFTPAAIIRGLAMIRTAGRYGERVVTHEATFRVIATLRQWFFAQIEPLSPAQLYHQRSGDLLGKLQKDVDRLDAFYLRIALPIISAVIGIAVVTLFMTLYDISSAVITFLLLIVGGFALPIALNRLANPLARQEVLVAGQMRTYSVEFTQGIGELLIFNAEQEKISQLKNVQTTWLDAQTRLHKIRSLGGSVQGFLAHMALWSIILVCAPLVSNNILSGPQLAMMSLLSLAAFEAVAPLPLAFTSWAELKEAMTQLESVAEQKALRTEPVKESVIPSNADITLCRLSFTYPKTNKKILDDISVLFPHGTRSLITGNSGSGKSTLLQIIEALYPVQNGSCWIGDTDINQLNSDQLRSKISVISQHTQLINGTLADNLRLAKPDATDTELLVALNKATLGDFIDIHPDGLNTWLGDTGAKVSGGQARRISIAQALLKDARLWLLDEPTEGIDQSTSAQLVKLLDQYLIGRTAIIVSHQSLPGLLIDQHFVMRNGQLTQHH